jgi:pimeloyl-ACP methyl ester carboxylesterase
MTLADGRELGWTECGDLDGWPVLGFHGTPGSRRQICLDEAQPLAAGVRLIAPDRPGYGFSTFQPARRLVEWPSDVEQLADHLGIDRFSVMGVSGGGPHAAACAALLGDRVAVSGIVSGAGPLSHPRLAKDVTGAERVISSLARRGAVSLRMILIAEVAVARRFPRPALALFVRSLPPPDAAVFNRPEMRRLFELEIGRTSPTTGRAMAQDLQLFASDWGFDLAEIRIPVVLWHGTEDRAVPEAHAQLMHREIKGSVLHTVVGEGHLLIVDRLDSILRELVGTS